MASQGVTRLQWRREDGQEVNISHCKLTLIVVAFYPFWNEESKNGGWWWWWWLEQVGGVVNFYVI